MLHPYITVVACIGPGQYLRRAADVTSTDHDAPSEVIPRPQFLPVGGAARRCSGPGCTEAATRTEVMEAHALRG